MTLFRHIPTYFILFGNAVSSIRSIGQLRKAFENWSERGRSLFWSHALRSEMSWFDWSFYSAPNTDRSDISSADVNIRSTRRWMPLGLCRIVTFCIRKCAERSDRSDTTFRTHGVFWQVCCDWSDSIFPNAPCVCHSRFSFYQHVQHWIARFNFLMTQGYRLTEFNYIKMSIHQVVVRYQVPLRWLGQSPYTQLFHQNGGSNNTKLKSRKTGLWFQCLI